MPIRPTNFDRAFDKLGVKNFRTSYNCSWENYCQFNDLLHQIKELLIQKGIKDVTLLNAHSFVWVIREYEQELNHNKIDNGNILNDLSDYKELDQKSQESIIKSRIGQGRFRDILLKYWEKSSVTGCKKYEVLIASHIKPWSECNTKEAIDPFNGLLLTPTIDKLFDIGLIAFDDNGKIILSSNLDKNSLNILGVNNLMEINRIDNRHLKYLKYHRNNVFTE